MSADAVQVIPAVAAVADADAPVATGWAELPLRERVRRVAALRHVLADRAESFLEPLRRLPHRRSDAESLAGELIPLADACAFLEREACAILRPRRVGRRGRPVWLGGVRAEIRREPLGRVLVIGPANYPLMLPGVQVVQALAAGNRVLFKPAPGTAAVARVLCDALRGLGVPPDALTLLGEDPASARAWIGRVDKVFLTGGEASGRAVLRELAEVATPAVMELSGCDAVFVLPGAHLQRVAAALRFGLTFNSSATCMAPRRVLADDAVADELIAALAATLGDVSDVYAGAAAAARLNELAAEAVAQGARVVSGTLPYDGRPVVLDHARASARLLAEDVMAPWLAVVRVPDEAAALAAYDVCPYRLGASVFGPEAVARALAARIPAGSVVVNDLIAPTADPRVPFGSAGGRSGFGVTRGAEGLMEMTRVRTVSVRRGRGTPRHLRPDAARAGPVLRAILAATHGRGLLGRARGWVDVARQGRELTKASTTTEQSP